MSTLSNPIEVCILRNNEIAVSRAVVSDSVLYERMKFAFPESWEDYTKTVVFRNGDTTLSVILNGDSDLCTGTDECYIPHEVIKFPEFTVSVFGVLGDSRATTPQAAIRVIKSGYGEGDEPSDPTPTEYQQLVNLANETKQIAQSVRTDADNGVFKGDKGDTGPQGEKGETGAQGPQGLKGDKGDKGDTGEQGIQGVQGIQGLKGDKGDDGYTPQKGVDYFTDEDIAGLNIPVVDQTYTPDSENAQSGVAVAEAVSPMRQTIVIDTPVWETQPTIEGTLNESFKTWESEAYYITLKNTDGTALESGQFKLCTKYDGYATAIDQVFALSSTYIKENNIVDFKSISSDRTSFEMRNGGVTGITIYPKNPKSQRYIFSVYHSGLMKGKATTHYVYLIDNVGLRLGNDATYVVNVGTYTGYSGFLLTLASSSNAVVSKFGYKITVERTRAGLNVQLSGMTSFKGALEYEGYSDFTKVIDNALEEDLTRFTLNSQNPTAAFWFANGSSVTFEEFA